MKPADNIEPLTEDVPEGAQEVAPRPPTPSEIIGMMDAAAAAREEQKETEVLEHVSAGEPLRFHGASFWFLWAFIAFGIGALILAGISGGFLDQQTAYFAGAGVFAALGLGAWAARRFMSPTLLAGVMLRRASGRSANEAAELAGAEILDALGLAEGVLDTDDDARLVTRRDGVVTYANKAYIALANEAGVMGPAGLPPRIDRLFAQQGVEATKIFRLCKAAKGAESAEEVIYQLMGVSGGGRRRRFEVTVRPIKNSEEHVAWRLRELAIEDEQQDHLAVSFADFPTPVFALEKSGQIAWVNAAMREALGVDRGAVRHLSEIVLGESDPLIRAILNVDRTPQKSMVRRAAGDPLDVEFVGFRRGGIGEGFVCVQMNIDEPVVQEAAEITLSSDVSESPFGVAVIEGEFGRDARIVEANKAFSDSFNVKKKNAPLARIFDKETLSELATSAKKKPRANAMPMAIETSIGEGARAQSYALYPRHEQRRRGSYGGRKTYLYSVDITDRKQMEEEYAQDQKLRAIGELASNVSHDFNNYLQVVIGNCDILMLRHPAGDPAYKELVQIRESAQRAANTTKQLLIYSRKQTLKREVVSITEILRESTRFLNRAIGEKVRLELINGRALPPIKVDRLQLESAIMNLAVNARDAMAPEGGSLTITTKRIEENDIAGLNIAGLAECDHVLIEVADTGPGVPQSLIEKVFDPFFTTKEAGKGTGLGLSAVYGSIRQMGGAVELESVEGEGATFKLYLPAYDDTADEETDTTLTTSTRRSEPVDLTGAGRILVVEDEESVRAFAMAALVGECGYEVTTAEDGEEALEILEDEEDGFDLILSDVMMNIMDGPTFVQKAREELNLRSKIIFMSAYAEDAVRDQLDHIDGAGYIQKPFTLKSLATLVKQTLYEDDDQ